MMVIGTKKEINKDDCDKSHELSHHFTSGYSLPFNSAIVLLHRLIE